MACELTYDREVLLASAGRVRDLAVDDAGIRFVCEAPRGVRVTTALRVAAEPSAVRVGGAPSTDRRYDGEVGVLWVRHDGVPSGVQVHVALQDT